MRSLWVSNDTFPYHQITGDPFPLTSDRKGWQTAFTIEQD
jgi:hypothetical protein